MSDVTDSFSDSSCSTPLDDSMSDSNFVDVADLDNCWFKARVQLYRLTSVREEEKNKLDKYLARRCGRRSKDSAVENVQKFRYLVKHLKKNIVDSEPETLLGLGHTRPRKTNTDIDWEIEDVSVVHKYKAKRRKTTSDFTQKIISKKFEALPENIPTSSAQRSTYDEKEIMEHKAEKVSESKRKSSMYLKKRNHVQEKKAKNDQNRFNNVAKKSKCSPIRPCVIVLEPLDIKSYVTLYPNLSVNLTNKPNSPLNDEKLKMIPVVLLKIMNFNSSISAISIENDSIVKTRVQIPEKISNCVGTSKIIQPKPTCRNVLEENQVELVEILTSMNKPTESRMQPANINSDQLNDGKNKPGIEIYFKNVQSSYENVSIANEVEAPVCSFLDNSKNHRIQNNLNFGMIIHDKFASIKVADNIVKNAATDNFNHHKLIDSIYLNKATENTGQNELAKIKGIETNSSYNITQNKSDKLCAIWTDNNDLNKSLDIMENVEVVDICVNSEETEVDKDIEDLIHDSVIEMIVKKLDDYKQVSSNNENDIKTPLGLCTKTKISEQTNSHSFRKSKRISKRLSTVKDSVCIHFSSAKPCINKNKTNAEQSIADPSNQSYILSEPCTKRGSQKLQTTSNISATKVTLGYAQRTKYSTLKSTVNTSESSNSDDTQYSLSIEPGLNNMLSAPLRLPIKINLISNAVVPSWASNTSEKPYVGTIKVRSNKSLGIRKYTREPKLDISTAASPSSSSPSLTIAEATSNGHAIDNLYTENISNLPDITITKMDTLDSVNNKLIQRSTQSLAHQIANFTKPCKVSITKNKDALSISKLETGKKKITLARRPWIKYKIKSKKESCISANKGSKVNTERTKRNLSNFLEITKQYKKKNKLYGSLNKLCAFGSCGKTDDNRRKSLELIDSSYNALINRDGLINFSKQLKFDSNFESPYLHSSVSTAIATNIQVFSNNMSDCKTTLSNSNAKEVLLSESSANDILGLHLLTAYKFISKAQSTNSHRDEIYSFDIETQIRNDVSLSNLGDVNELSNQSIYTPSPSDLSPDTGLISPSEFDTELCNDAYISTIELDAPNYIDTPDTNKKMICTQSKEKNVSSSCSGKHIKEKLDIRTNKKRSTLIKKNHFQNVDSSFMTTDAEKLSSDDRASSSSSSPNNIITTSGMLGQTEMFDNMDKTYNYILRNALDCKSNENLNHNAVISKCSNMWSIEQSTNDPFSNTNVDTDEDIDIVSPEYEKHTSEAAADMSVKRNATKNLCNKSESLEQQMVSSSQEGEPKNESNSLMNVYTIVSIYNGKNQEQSPTIEQINANTERGKET